MTELESHPLVQAIRELSTRAEFDANEWCDSIGPNQLSAFERLRSKLRLPNQLSAAASDELLKDLLNTHQSVAQHICEKNLLLARAYKQMEAFVDTLIDLQHMSTFASSDYLKERLQELLDDSDLLDRFMAASRFHRDLPRAVAPIQ